MLLVDSPSEKQNQLFQSCTLRVPPSRCNISNGGPKDRLLGSRLGGFGPLYFSVHVSMEGFEPPSPEGDAVTAR